MILRYTERAATDIELAFEWYESQRTGLGFEFLDCVEASIQKILRFPEMFEKQHAVFRRCVVRRFPFSLFYTIEKEAVILHAVFDTRSNPEKRPK